MTKITPDELRDRMLLQFIAIAKQCAGAPDLDPYTGIKNSIEDRCIGVVISILTELDGSGSLPSFDLVAHVYPDDEDQSCEGVVISDMLHEHLAKLL